MVYAAPTQKQRKPSEWGGSFVYATRKNPPIS